MDFGTKVLVEDHSIYTKFVSLGNGREVSLKVLREGKFIFHRPDTGRMIIDLGSNLVQLEQMNVYPINDVNLKIFKEKIQDKYKLSIGELVKKEMSLTMEKSSIDTRLLETETLILKLNDKQNQIEYTEGRARQIQGVSKNMRKMERRSTGLDKAIQELRDDQKKYFNEMEWALQFVNQQFPAS